MRLIDDIIDLAVDNTGSISVLLRKCLVLAHELKNQRLRTWVEKELDGYSELDEVPEYRRVVTIARGTFFGPLGAQINNQPLAPGILNKEHRGWATEAILRQPIVAYELVKDEKDTPAIPWPPDLTVMYQSKFIEGYALNRAWLEVPASHIVALVDTIRNRILRFALEIKDELGATGDDVRALPTAKIEQYVTNYIYGGNILIAGTAESFSQISHLKVETGDLDALSRVLKQIGVSEYEFEELKEALEHDNATPKTQGIGEKTRSWVSKAAKEIGKGTLKLGMEAARTVITQWLGQYLGLPPS